MTIDGFLPEHRDAFVAFSPDTARRAYAALGWIARRLSVEVLGMDKVPSGPAILVANHAFGWDVAFPMAAIKEQLHRTVWALGEHAWWKIPFVRRFVAAVGTVDGTPENLDKLLERGELVLVMPGGLREAVKPRELRYRLLWGHRYGFVRAAIRNQAPIVPLAAVGADDWFDLVGDAYRRGARWTGTDIPIPLSSRILPIPHLVRLRYIVGDPIRPPVAPSPGDEMETLKRFRHEVEGALHELIETELGRRTKVAVD